MKYMVMVNQKYMVTVEANSLCGAEHVILDNIDGIEGAQAFDAKGMATQFFADMMQNCETVSYSELLEISARYTEACREMGKLKETLSDMESEITRLYNLIDDLRCKQEEVGSKVYEKQRAITIAKEELGLRA